MKDFNVSDFDQALRLMTSSLPSACGTFFQQLLDDDFTREEALELTEIFLMGLMPRREGGDDD